jgi:hypothetical protein
MQLNIPIIADMEMIQAKKQARINYNAEQSNLKRCFKDYQVGDQVFVLKDAGRKLDSTVEPGPSCVIQQVHANGTITIQRNEGIYEQINIRRIKPCRN